MSSREKMKKRLCRGIIVAIELNRGIQMKSVNFQLDHHNSLELTQIDEQLFEVRLEMNGRISLFYMTREQLGTDGRIEALQKRLVSDFFPDSN